MESGQYFLYNDSFYDANKKIISANNRSFRFGDGLFETMRMVDGNIPLLKYHFERLFASLALMKFEPPQFNADHLSDQIKNIAAKNNHSQTARIRLTIFRGDGGLYDYENNQPNYIIQTWKTSPLSFLNEGLKTGLYISSKKICDNFSHIKSNNFLPYVMAALWMKENDFDEAFIINNYNRIAESTIANIFIVKDETIKTPALNEGCVNGVMRRFLIEQIKNENLPFEEKQVEENELAEAHEIFLTNAASGIRPVQQYKNHHYGSELSKYLFNKFLVPLFNIHQ